MNNEKKNDVYKILLTPIVCSSEIYKRGEKYLYYTPEKPKVFKCENVIKSTQSYYPKYIGKTGEVVRYEFQPDEDMSDFACGFYEILYRSILNGQKIVDGDGNFSSTQFAGDTMTSVSKLPKLRDKYHCLANFWLIPMELGRKSKHELSKTSSKIKIEDFMDRFLILMRYRYNDFASAFNEYFSKIKTFKEFSKIHFLKTSYVHDNYDVKMFSDILKEGASDEVYELIKMRAKAISESLYCDELWDYFFKNNLI